MRLKRLVSISFVLLSVCISLLAGAQQTHFMYIQSDNKAPFYVVLDQKTYNSNGTGYLIIAKLAKGNHAITLGFPDKQSPDQAFTVPVTDADAGYALKNYGDKGWGLYNLQSMAVIMGKARPGGTTQPVTAAAPKTATASKPAVTDAPKPAATNMFGDMLSAKVDDPELQTRPAATAAAPKNTGKPKPAAASATTPTELPKPAATETEPIEATTADMDAAATRGVIKAAENAGKEGTGFTFIDFNAKGADTVKIFIPAAGDAAAVEVPANAPATRPETASKPVTAAAPKPQTSPAQLEIGVDTAVAVSSGVSNPFYSKPADKKQETEVTVDTAYGSQVEVVPADPVPATTGKPAYNSNCTGGMAADKDLEKLKKKMVSENSDDKMIAVAKKAFKSKCYTAEQIKELGRLFYTDDSRYQFYDAAYPFVYDVNNYITLEKMLIDNYYKKRFRTMLRM